VFHVAGTAARALWLLLQLPAVTVTSPGVFYVANTAACVPWLLLLYSCCCCSWVTPPGVFQAYVTYATNGYLAHLSWASAWMCKHDTTYCAKAGAQMLLSNA
jgi:hypothetical protein